jgi:hypothetical protein
MVGKIGCIVITLLAASAFAAGGNDDPVTVQRIDATVSTHTYDPARPPKQMPATQPDEAGVTVSDFSCVAQVSGQITDRAKIANDATVTVKMAAVHITLKLTIAEWMDQLAPVKIWSHENGHRDIALLFYRRADLVAASIAHAWLGKTITASGSDATSAAKEAVTEAAQKITDDYMIQVRDQSELVQEAYDHITAHGTNEVDEYDAIQQALAEVAKRHLNPPDSENK